MTGTGAGQAEPGPADRRRRFARRYGGVGIALILMAILLAVPDRNPSGDAYEYAAALRGDHPLPPSPNKLLLIPAVSAFHHAIVLPLFGGDVDPLVSLLGLSRISFLLWGMLFAVIARRVAGGPLLAMAMTFGLLSSNAALLFATDGEPILLAHLPLLAGAAIHVVAREKTGIALHGVAGIAYGLAILTFVNNVFPVVAIAATLLLFDRRRSAAWVIAFAAGLPAAGFALAHRLLAPELPLLSWLTSYGGGGVNLGYGGVSLIGLARAFLGMGDSLAPVRGAARFVRARAEGAGSVEALPGDGGFFLLWLAVTCAVAVLFVAALVRARRRRGDGAGIVGVAAVSVVLLFLFNLNWIGSDPQFWIPALPCLWVLFGYGADRGARSRIAFHATALLLLPANLAVSVIPLRADEAPERNRTALEAEVEPGSLVVTPGLDWIDGLGRYRPPPGIRLFSLWRESTEPRWAGDAEGYYAFVDSLVGDALDRGTPVYVKRLFDETRPRDVPWREMAPRGFAFEEIRDRLSRYPTGDPIRIGDDIYRRLSAPAAIRGDDR